MVLAAWGMGAGAEKTVPAIARTRATMEAGEGDWFILVDERYDKVVKGWNRVLLMWSCLPY